MRISFVLFLVFLVGSCKTETKPSIEPPKEAKSLMAGSDTLIYPEEKYFKRIRQITFGGDNAEAY